MASNLQRTSSMKLRTASAVVVAMLLLGAPLAASAQTPNADLDVGDGSGIPGESGVDVSVDLASHDGAQVVSLNFTISYEGAELEFVEASAGSAAAGKTVESSLPGANPINVIIYGGTNPVGDGTVAVITFNVKGTATPGEYTLALSEVVLSDAAAQPIQSNPSGGTFTVIGPAETEAPTPTEGPTVTMTPSVTPTASQTPTQTLTLTQAFTPTQTLTRTQTLTPTRTVTRTRTKTPTVSPTGPTHTPSRTPTITQTPTRTLTPTRTKYVSPTPTLTGTLTITPDTPTPEVTASETVEVVGTLTPTSEGGAFVDLRGQAGTETTQAKFDQDVAATATALAGSGGQGGSLPGALGDALIDWALHNVTWLVLGGLGLGAILIAVWMGIAIFRGPAPEQKKKK